MALEGGVALLVLLAAVLHAGWNAMVKAGADGLARQTLVMCGCALAGLAVAPFVPVPPLAAWPYLVASLIIHVGYNLLLVAAYARGDLSQVYPIARGTAPLMVAVGAWALAGEALAPLALAGVVIGSAGLVALAFTRHQIASMHAVWPALGTAVTVAAYSIADGLGVRQTPEPLSYIAWLFLLEAPLMLAPMAWIRRRQTLAALRAHLWTGLGGGIAAAVAYGIVIWAMGRAPLAHVVALRETSVIIAAALGALVLREPFGQRRIAAAGVVAAGIAMMQLAS